MATFVTRLERDHEALLETLRGRLDEAETRSRAIEARLSDLEQALRRPEGEAAGRPLEARVAALEEALREALAGATPASAGVRASRGDRRKGPGASAPPPPEGREPAPGSGERPPWQDATEAMRRREAEVLARAERGDAPRNIAAALGRGLGEVELVLRLAERAGRDGVGAAPDGRGGL